MAKKNDTAYETFLADLKAINPKIEEILTDEKVSAKLKDGVLARAEFSSKMDELKSERESFQTFANAEKQKIEGWQKWYGEATTEVAGIQDQLKAYQEKFGELDKADKTKVAANAGLTVEEFTKRLNETIQQHDMAALKFADDLTDIKIEHRDRFKEKLDTAAVYKLAGEKNLPLDLAYKEFISDRVAEANKTKYEEDLKRAREEGAAEYASKHNLPILDSASALTHVLDVKTPLTNQHDRVAAATKAFLESTSKR